MHLRVRPPGGVEPGTHLLLLDTDDQVLATLPVDRARGLLEALVGVDDLPAGYFGVVRLAVGTEAAWVRIRRRGSDLADPHHAVLLPELYDRPDPGPGRGPGSAGTPTGCSRSAHRPGRGRAEPG